MPAAQMPKWYQRNQEIRAQIEQNRARYLAERSAAIFQTARARANTADAHDGESHARGYTAARDAARHLAGDVCRIFAEQARARIDPNDRPAIRSYNEGCARAYDARADHLAAIAGGRRATITAGKLEGCLGYVGAAVTMHDGRPAVIFWFDDGYSIIEPAEFIEELSTPPRP